MIMNNPGLLAEFPHDPVTSAGVTPLDIIRRAAITTGAAFDTAFICYPDTVILPFVYLGRARVSARFVYTVFHTYLGIPYLQMAFSINNVPVQLAKKKMLKKGEKMWYYYLVNLYIQFFEYINK